MQPPCGWSSLWSERPSRGLLVRHWFAGTTTRRTLVVRRDLARGQLPNYDVPVSPTPHPLSNLAGTILSPLGDGAETALVVIGFLALGALAALTYALLPPGSAPRPARSRRRS